MNERGEVLISRLFRTDVKRSASDQFRIHVLTNPNVRSPVTTINNISFLHVRHEGLYLVAALKQNTNLSIVFEFLYKIIWLSKRTFNGFNEEIIRNNFVLIYELLDEICDFGYPQTTDMDSLVDFMKANSLKGQRTIQETAHQISIQATGSVSWRKPDIKYRKNEAFVDVIESINVLVSSLGTILRSDVVGTVSMRAYLSGMPECKIALNDALSIDASNSDPSTKNSKAKVILDDVQFHQCVNLSDYEKTKSIQFIPPDGDFDLIKYRVMNNIQLPFRLTPSLTIDNNSVLYSINLRSLFDAKLSAQNVVIKIPVPPNTRKVKHITVSGFGSASLGGGIGGKVKHSVDENCIVWKIPKMQGCMDLSITAEAALVIDPNTSNNTNDTKTHNSNKELNWNKPPISLSFSVLMYTASGLSVRYLKVFERSGYSTVKWVRYLTKGGSYQVKF